MMMRQLPPFSRKKLKFEEFADIIIGIFYGSSLLVIVAWVLFTFLGLENRMGIEYELLKRVNISDFLDEHKLTLTITEVNPNGFHAGIKGAMTVANMRGNTKYFKIETSGTTAGKAVLSMCNILSRNTIAVGQVRDSFGGMAWENIIEVPILEFPEPTEGK